MPGILLSGKAGLNIPRLNHQLEEKLINPKDEAIILIHLSFRIIITPRNHAGFKVG